jgi:glycosyltransferase involved in cell wall biosynthesis
MRFGTFVVMAGRQAGGPETYEHRLVRALAALDRKNEFHIFCYSRSAADSFALAQENVRFHVLRPGPRWLSTLATLPLQMRAAGVDLLHATFVPPLLSPAPYVFTMHCFSNFVHPEFYHPVVRWRLNGLIRRGLDRARVVLCVSRTVRDLVAETFKSPEERLAVVYNGVGDDFHPVEPALARDVLARRYGITGPYALFVGQLKARKNIKRILEAFARFRLDTRSDLRLVLAGRRDWSAAGMDEIIDRERLRPHVIELGHLRHEDLAVLYSGARMFVFPSLWEGFGIPVIEAMACGTPVITSDDSCLPEIAGGAALLVDPTSVEAIAEAMERVDSDESLREGLRAKGLERARFFSWRRTAEQTLAAYRMALG